MIQKNKIYQLFFRVKKKFFGKGSQQILESDFCYFGDKASVSPDIKINRPDRVILKEGARIQSGAIINSLGGLHVGRYSGIGYNCVIFTVDHRFRGANAIPFDNHVLLKPVVIRDFVWIGANVKIMPGVEIGEGAILGLGSVITKNVKPCSIVVGNPAEIIGYRNKEQFEELKKKGHFSLLTFHGKYKESVFPLSRRRFQKELKELGL